MEVGNILTVDLFGLKITLEEPVANAAIVSSARSARTRFLIWREVLRFR